MSQWSLLLQLPLLAAHLPLFFGEKAFLLTSYAMQRHILGGLVCKYASYAFILPAQIHIFPTYQRILTLPEDILFWKAYQDALLSIALSHPWHHKASKSPWIFFYRDETVVFCIINRKIINFLYKFHNDNLQYWIIAKHSGWLKTEHVISKQSNKT